MHASVLETAEQGPGIGIRIICALGACCNGAPGLSGQVAATDARGIRPTGICELALAQQPAEMIGGVARLSGGTPQRKQLVRRIVGEAIELAQQFVTERRAIDEGVEAAQLVASREPALAKCIDDGGSGDHRPAA